MLKVHFEMVYLKRKIREVLLQVAIYCGVPAAVDSFRIAKEAIKEFESEQ